MEKVKVLVVGNNAGGAPDVFSTEVTCTAGEIEDGDHYVRATEIAVKAGFEPKIAMDETDPGWSHFALGREAPAVSPGSVQVSEADASHEAVLRRIMDALKVTYLPNTSGGVEGADFVAEVADLCRREMDAVPGLNAFVVFGVEAGGYLTQSGELSDDFTAIFDSDAVRELASMGYSVVALPAQDLVNADYEWPSYEDLAACAAAALSRGAKYGFAIGPDNASEVMREELEFLDLSGVHDAMNPVLERVIHFAAERARVASRPGDRL